MSILSIVYVVLCFALLATVVFVVRGIYKMILKDEEQVFLAQQKRYKAKAKVLEEKSKEN